MISDSASPPLPFSPLTQRQLTVLSPLLRSDAKPMHSSTPISLIREARLELKKCRDHASKIRSALLEAENHRKMFLNYIHACESTMAPIRKLPEELLRLIFAFACDYLVISGIHTYRLHKSPPQVLTLSKVCALWYRLVRTSQELWNRISLETSDYDTTGCAERNREFLMFALERSSVLPLTIAIRHEGKARSVEDDSPSAVCEGIIGILAEETANRKPSSRIKELILRADWETIKYGEPFFSFEEGLPELTTLAIQTSPAEDYDDPVHIFPSWSSVPKLHQVVLRQCHTMHVSLPWKQLTLLDMAGVWDGGDEYFQALLYALESCRSLETVQIGTFKLESEDEDEEPVRSNLQSMEISTGRHFSNVIAVFRSVKLPKLESLKLHAQDRKHGKDRKPNSDFPIQAFLDFSSRSRFMLRILTLHNIYASPASTHALIANLPHLNELTLADSDSQLSDFISTMVENMRPLNPRPSAEEEDIPLPKLQSLDICTSQDSKTFDFQNFVGIIKARCQTTPTCMEKTAVGSLMKVKLLLKKVERKEWVEDLEASLEDLVVLSKAGLYLHIADKDGTVSPK
jgi:hypothetical protein